MPFQPMTVDRETRLDQAATAIQEGKHNEAVTLCRNCIQTDQYDAEAWSVLGVALLPENQREALQALRRATQLEPAEPRWYLNLGIGLGGCGQPEAAERACREAVSRSDGAIEALGPWADSLSALSKVAQAANALKQAIALRPSALLYRKLSVALAQQGDAKAAITALQQASHGKSLPLRDRLAVVRLQIQLQNFDVAKMELDALLTQAPHDADTAMLALQFYRALGHMDTAQAILEAAYAANPGNRLLIAELLEGKAIATGALKDAEVAVANDSIPTAERRTLAFGLARYHDRGGEFETAWNYVSKANTLYDDEVNFQVEPFERELAAALQLFQQTSDVNTETGSPDFVYIMGPPRSGGTLLQTLLAAAPGVHSVGERAALLPWILPLLSMEQSAMQERWNDIRDDLHRADIAGLRGLRSDATWYVDKTTHNAHVAGLIHRLHPGAFFIDSRRDPRDTALSILFQDFSSIFNYSRSLDDIVAYLVFQRKAIDVWRAAGVPILIHDHEAFVRSPEETGSALFRSLGLHWYATFLKAANRGAVVKTFSVSQVREEISTSFSGRWRNYVKFLGSLPEQLAPLIREA